MKRDRLTLALIFMIPLVQLLLFGYAIQTEVKHIPTVVFDQSLSPFSRDMLEAFSASGYFDISHGAASYEEVNRYIDSGQAQVGIIFPPDYARQLYRGSPATVQVIVDASDSMVQPGYCYRQLYGLIKSQQVLFQKTRMSSLLMISGFVPGITRTVSLLITWYRPYWG